MAILSWFGAELINSIVLTPADGSRVSIAIMRLCNIVCDSVCVRTIKPKRLKLKSPNFAQRL